MRHHVGKALGQIDMAQEPDDAVEQEVLHRRVEFELQFPRNPVVEAVERGVERGHAIAVAHGGKGRCDGRGRGAGLVGNANDQRRPAAVDHGIGEPGGDDFPVQAMVSERVGKTLGDGFRKITAEFAGKIGIVRHRGFEQVLVQRQLGVGEQYRQFRPRERLRTAAALGELHVVGQILDCAVEQPARFQRLNEPLQKAEILHAVTFGERQRERLQVIVAQHQAGDVIGHFGEQRDPPVHRQAAVAERNAQRDLDIDLHVGGVDAGRIVDRVGVEPHAAQRRLDAAALGHAEIGALADHLAAQILADGANGIVGAVADRLVAFVGGAHIGADAAEKQ